MTYILDTNIITEILKENEKVIKKAQTVQIEGKEILINAISYYEIKRGLLSTNATKQLEKFEQLCKIFGLALLDNKEIFDIASLIYKDLKQKGKIIEDADILIASISLNGNFILISADNDFNRIKNLRVENWLV
ncbi:MAG TPA: PIN domain-containing protein [Caldisericia bacterium]|nr:PIN domain-containing protein [Caldisericia bacterium]HPB33697.1 PIN domain-containing protein [Caldisericia bacterium]HQL66990.1 PIN domain-containing protein [Caldisericia bacterium]HQN47949.1 PIN domain-containing protein [Caldisericia bacterium]HQO99875.1 PIN domain-containing protein [Caldisericia bacterium]